MSAIDAPAGVPRELDLAAYAASIAQIEEPDHPLPPPGRPGIPCEILDTHHVAAVSSMGACHIAVRQDHSIDQSRFHLLQVRWFTAFLAASFQRGELHRLERAVQALQKDASGKPDHDVVLKTMMRLRAEVAEDRISGYHDEIASREVLNRYYGLARAANRIPEHERGVREAITALESGIASENQLEGTRRLVSMQVKIEWIEIFLLAIYGLEVAHILGEAFGMREPAIATGALLALLLAGAVAYFYLAPWQHEHGEMKQKIRRRFLAVAGCFLLLALCYGFIGHRYFPRHGSPAVKAALKQFEEAETALLANSSWTHPRISPMVAEAWRLETAARSDEQYDPEEAAGKAGRAVALLKAARSTAAAASRAETAEEQFRKQCPTDCQARPGVAAQLLRAREAFRDGDFDLAEDLYTAAVSAASASEVGARRARMRQ